MKIAAFYIPQDYLPFIFVDNHEALIINFGGKNIYHLDGGYVKVSEEDKMLPKWMNLLSNERKYNGW